MKNIYRKNFHKTPGCSIFIMPLWGCYIKEGLLSHDLRYIYMENENVVREILIAKSLSIIKRRDQTFKNLVPDKHL